jgi:hypothetical protein
MRLFFNNLHFDDLKDVLKPKTLNLFNYLMMLRINVGRNKSTAPDQNLKVAETAVGWLPYLRHTIVIPGSYHVKNE